MNFARVCGVFKWPSWNVRVYESYIVACSLSSDHKSVLTVRNCLWAYEHFDSSHTTSFSRNTYDHMDKHYKRYVNNRTRCTKSHIHMHTIIYIHFILLSTSLMPNKALLPLMIQQKLIKWRPNETIMLLFLFFFMFLYL